MIASALRIAVGVVVGFALLALLVGPLVRLPSFGREPFPEGPRADPAALRAHVERLCSLTPPRSWGTPEGIEAAGAYVASVLSRTRAVVSFQDYRAGGRTTRNVVARFGPAAGPLTVVGAHYDVYGSLPGADDNASGVAGLLEIARLLDARTLARPVELAFYSTEEPPFFASAEMGSAVHARSLRERDVAVEAMIGLEMIGYFTPKQPFSTLLLTLIYPTRGNFIAVVGRWQDRGLALRLKRSFRGATSVPAVSYTGPVLFGSDLSDHRNYWAAGIPAVMVTDTAFWRNRNYHTATDVPESLDYDSMAGVVDGVLAAVVHLSR